MRIRLDGFKRFVHWLFDLSTRKLVNKLILLFTSIIILVVVSITYISYKIIENESVNSSITSNSNNLRLVNKNLANYFADIEQLSLPQLKYDQLMSALNQSEEYASSVFFENYLKELFYSRTDIEGVYLYIIDQHKYFFISRGDPNISKVRVTYDADIAKQPWFKQALDNPLNRFIQSLLIPQGEGYPLEKQRSYMAYHRTIRNLTDKRPKGIISFYFNSSVSDKIIQDIPVKPNEHVEFMDSNNTPFYMDSKPFYEQMRNSNFFSVFQNAGNGGPFTWTSESNKYMVISNVEENNNWKLVKTIPYSEINKAAQTNRNVSFLIGAIFLIVSVFLVTWTSNAITMPLKILSRKMSRFGDGDFDVEAEAKGRDEIAQLANRFNMMVIKTNELISEKYKMKLIEKSAILKALEAEINPHFLYNALQAISTKALKNDMHDISEMVDALALTLRYCISGKDIVKLRNEINHIDNYLVIQKARFGSRLQVIYELPDDMLEIEIPKLSIQSLVENSVKHALEKVYRPITILISVRLESGNAVITVKDDGPGISAEKLNELLRSFQTEWEDWEGENIGLKNLNARLKLIFGDSAGIDIKTDGSGSQMDMIIPLGGESLNV